MGFSDWLSLIGAIVAGVSLGVAGLSAWFAKQQAKAAEESNRISAAALDVSRRQLDLQISAEGNIDAPKASPYVPPWRVEHVSGSAYALTNGGDETAYDVHIEPPADTPAYDTDFPQIGPMSSKQFTLIFTMASPSREISVTWCRSPEAEPEAAWTTSLPSLTP
ncbi:MAG: hypothetical protein LKI98_04180 [Bifidobacterium crudilactis]|nr:hypothetical protein [Bifidobacterium crudilactis]MCI1889618.1 hypothetical protein [Bifidobacterium crudilactis]